MTLTKHEYARFFGGHPHEAGQVHFYGAGSMPPGQEAHVVNFGAPYRNDWRIRMLIDGVEDWIPASYDTSDLAFAALQERVWGQLS